MRIWRKRAAVRRKNHSNLKKSFGMKVFRLLLPAAHPQPLSSLLEFTILRYSFFESHHISTWEAGGGQVSGRSMTVTVLCETLRTQNLMHNVAWTYNDPNYIVCGRLFSTLFHNVPLRPDLFLSCIPEFLERSVKILCQHIFHQITNPPLASSQHPRPKYLIRDYTPGRKLKIQRFNVEMFEICMFDSTAISINMLIQLEWFWYKIQTCVIIV